MPSNVPPEVYLLHRREIAEARRVAEESAAKYRLTLKRADRAGIYTKDMLALIALQRRDPEEAAASFRRMAEYAAMEGKSLPVPLQPDLFSDSQSDAPKEVVEEFRLQAIEQDGYMAGVGGTESSLVHNIHGAGTKEAQAWARGWSKGAEFKKNCDELAGEEEPKVVQPRRRADNIVNLQ